MKRFLLLISFLLSLSIPLFSQELRDVIHTKDGSIIKGIISDSTEGVIKVETCCGSILAIPETEVLSLDSELVPKTVKSVKQKGYINFTSTGVLLGSRANERIAPFSLLSENSYRTNEYIAVGGLIGYEMLDEAVIPLGVNVKGFVIKGAENMYIGLTGGYSFSLENPNTELYESTSGGPFFNIELGILIPVSQDNSFFIAMGYRYNKLKYERSDWWLGNVEREIKYHRISIRFGFTIY